MSEVPSDFPAEIPQFLSYETIRKLIGSQLEEPKATKRPDNFRAILNQLRADKEELARSENPLLRERWENALVNLHGLAQGIDYEHIWASDFPRWTEDDFKSLLKAIGEA